MLSVDLNVNNSAYAKQSGLSNVQMELMKLYSTNLNHNELNELKRLLANHFSKKAVLEADNIWEEQKMSAQTMEDWLNEN
jgi:hypothetical protein